MTGERSGVGGGERRGIGKEKIRSMRKGDRKEEKLKNQI